MSLLKKLITTKNRLTVTKVICHYSLLGLLLVAHSTTALAQTTFEGKLKSVAFSDALGSNTAPTASFTFTRNGDSFTFDASGSTDVDGSITEYRWDFGDGTTAIDKTFSHVFSNDGTYPVTLTVIDNNSAVSIIQQSINTAQTDFLFQWNMDAENSAIDKNGNSITMVPEGGAYLDTGGVTGKAINLNGGYHAAYSPQSVAPSTLIAHTSGKVTIFGKRSTDTGEINLLYCSNQESVTALALYLTPQQLIQVGFAGTWIYSFSNGGSLTIPAGTGWHKFELSWDANGLVTLIVDDINIRTHSFPKGLQSPFTKLSFGTLSGSGYGRLDDITIE